MYYLYHTKTGTTCYYTDSKIMKKEAFVEVLKRKYHQVNAAVSAVINSTVKPKAQAGIKLIYANSKNGIAVGRILKENSELAGVIRDKLSEDDAAEKVVDIICEAISEYGAGLSKEEIKKAMQAEADEEPVGGAVIAYNNYVIIS